MAKVQAAALPPSLDLPSGYTIRVNALDPTTGAQITGVTISDLSILVTDVSGNLDLSVANPILIGINV